RVAHAGAQCTGPLRVAAHVVVRSIVRRVLDCAAGDAPADVKLDAAEGARVDAGVEVEDGAHIVRRGGRCEVLGDRQRVVGDGVGRLPGARIGADPTHNLDARVAHEV